MFEKNVVIGLDSGLEERPIALIVQMASQYDSSVYLLSGNKRVNAKSIMGMMGLGMKSGDSITIVADGVDEGLAVAELERYLSGQ
ncbi:MAG: HPr family phosphocarrier protein [Lachnospiraceae bacterium]|jgi:catabolite repression HPr-like protein|nr:HPr family phosphocarrier protein [Lachnospiraceae bacterium]